VKPSARAFEPLNPEPSGVVHRLPIPEGDEALVSALLSARPGGADAFIKRYFDHVKRMVVRVMGVDAEIEDIVHDVFLDALRTVGRLKDPGALRMWLTSIALFKARRVLRSRRRRSWLRLTAPDELNRFAYAGGGSELAEAMRCTYQVLNDLPADERIAFALRFVDGMELTEIAAVSRASVATIKRRLRRAEERFLRRARKYPVLAARIAMGGRWTS
jgi:RNA polymerase sigma-70 factor (ECF subfamily)